MAKLMKTIKAQLSNRVSASLKLGTMKTEIKLESLTNAKDVLVDLGRKNLIAEAVVTNVELLEDLDDEAKALYETIINKTTTES